VIPLRKRRVILARVGSTDGDEDDRRNLGGDPRFGDDHSGNTQKGRCMRVSVEGNGDDDTFVAADLSLPVAAFLLPEAKGERTASSRMRYQVRRKHRSRFSGAN
jgi:hypothetical protein